MDDDMFGGYEEYEASPYNGDDLDGGYHDGHWEMEDESDEDDDEAPYGPTDEFFYADEAQYENFIEDEQYEFGF